MWFIVDSTTVFCLFFLRTNQHILSHVRTCILALYSGIRIDNSLQYALLIISSQWVPEGRMLCVGLDLMSLGQHRSYVDSPGITDGERFRHADRTTDLPDVA